MFMNSINHFRAIAIIIIVIGHVYGMKTIDNPNLLEAVFINMSFGGTSLFVFISGFLFFIVFYNKYEFKKFISSKAANLIIPYTLLSVIPIIYIFTRDPALWHDFFLPKGDGIISEYITPTVLYYLTGGFLVAYWYIPFIFFMFVLSPVHVAFIRLNKKTQVILILCLLTLSLLIHRPVGNINIFHSTLYYFPVYLFGIWCAAHRTAIYGFFKGKDWLLLLIAVFMATIQAFSGDVGNYHKAIFVYNGLDIMLLQKLTLCLFFMVWLHRYEDYSHPLINIIAGTSFAIFFLHPYLILLIAGLQPRIGMPESFLSLFYLALVIPVIAICVASALVAKRLFHSRSRYLVGY